MDRGAGDGRSKVDDQDQAVAETGPRIVGVYRGTCAE